MQKDDKAGKMVEPPMPKAMTSVTLVMVMAEPDAESASPSLSGTEMVRFLSVFFLFSSLVSQLWIMTNMSSIDEVRH